MPLRKRSVRTLQMNEKRWCKVKVDCEVNTNSVFSNVRLEKLNTVVKKDTSAIGNYILVDFNQVNNLLRSAKCQYCEKQTLKLELGAKLGFSYNLKLLCSNCDENKTVVNTSLKSVPTGHDVNLRITQAFSHIGKASENIFAEIHREIKNAYENGTEIADLSVSFDGTWLTRGHTSLIGVGCVIDMHTRYVVDFEGMSKVCRHCSVAKNKLGQSNAEFSIWCEVHESECDINHLGSSTSMEMEAALTLWKRSTSLGFRYITVLSDGDCKTFNYLCEKKVYGPDIVIKKEECINHVSKRLGTALRSTVKDCRAQDAKPQHSKCPAGENSWCFYQSAIANGEKPNAHKLNVGTPINEKFLPKILPIYQRLASNELLERCIRCGTQNANESLHSMIWAKCPKEIFVNKRRVKRAVAKAVCEYNKGTVRTIVEIQKALGVATGGSTKQLATILDCRKQKFRKRHQDSSNKLALKLIKKAIHKKELLARRRDSAGQF
ncbi:uncharacterized protein TNCV_2291411 [Trichonephila clavipes]|uniref:Mutator-like transposase domain-containing protein n=1 Tax=Trichonephila clavipes TaxID=2585209 RepID=A0A8X6V1Z6_TRICX|nr:uncharacterized protein TNCV_2291411 [Trichonephila clavipes]